MSIGKYSLPLSPLILLLSVLAPGQGLAGLSPPDPATITHHELTIELIPASHELVARDWVELELSDHTTTVEFSLAPTLRVESIAMRTQTNSGDSGRSEMAASFTMEQRTQPSTQRIVVTLPSPHEKHVTLLWRYRGVIDDPPREPRHLRFVTPSETAGHVGPEGVYLSSESQWYPDIEGSLSPFQVSARVPRE